MVNDRLPPWRRAGAVKKVLHVCTGFSAKLFQIWTKIDSCDERGFQLHLLA